MTTTSATSRSCHRCARTVKLQGQSNVIARHKAAPGYWADPVDGTCMGSGENPCLSPVSESHQHPCRPIPAVGLTQAGSCTVDNATGMCETHQRIEG